LIQAALVTLGLALGVAQAREPSTTAETELQQALLRIEALEAQLERVETRLGAAEQQVPAPPRVSSTSGATVIDADETVQEAVSFGGPVIVHGRVRGPAVSFGGDIEIHDGGQVDGDAVSFGGQVRVQDGGEVRGDRLALGPATAQAWLPGLIDPSGRGQSLARRLVLLLSFAGAGVLVVGLFPALVERIAQSLQERPLRAGLVGGLATGLGLAGSVVLAATLIGVPLALVLLLMVGLSWVLGFIGLCQVIGDTLPIGDVGARRWAAFLAGVAVLASASALPTLGQVLLVTLGLFGAGAAVQTHLGTRALS
jgi:hypothetical protein